MTSYLIKKNVQTNSIVSMQYDLAGYKFNPKKRGNSYIEVKEVTVINPNMIDNILSIKFNAQFNKLMASALKVVKDDDATEGDAQVVLGEVELIRQIITNRYQKFLKRSKEDMFLKKLRLIENEMRIKILCLKETKQLNPDHFDDVLVNELDNDLELDEKSKGRGR